MKAIVSYFSILILVFACGTPTPSNRNEVDIPFEDVIQLSLNDVFKGEKIRQFLFQNQTEDQEANKLFLQGLDAYKNKKKLKDASDLFLQSIVKYPTSKSYYELGNVCMEQKNYKMALNAFGMAEKMGYEPFAQVMFNIARAHSQLKNFEQSGAYLKYALQAGYSNIENLEKNSDIALLREEAPWIYTQNLKVGLSGMSNVENLHWLQFKRQFMTIDLPLNLETDQSKYAVQEKNMISYDFERFIAEMRDERFSREVSKGFYNFAQVNETPNYVALIYIIKDEFNGTEAPLTYRLVTFTNTGKIIDKKEIAGREDYSKDLKTCVFSKDLTFSITAFETTFEKDPEEHGFYENKVTSKTKKSTEVFKINSDGTFSKIESDHDIAQN